MATVTVPVIAAFAYHGRSLSIGDTVTVTPIEAAALARQGVVSIESGYQAKVLASEPPKRRRGRPRKDGSTAPRNYRRRDLTAEP
jgi:hypothetical protein